MTDNPAPNLTMLEPIERMQVVLQQAVGRSVEIMRQADPAASAEIIAAELAMWVASALIDGFGEAAKPAVRAGFLRAFEALHDKPVSFIDAAKIKEAVMAIAKERREAEAATTGLILPTTH